MIELNQAEQKKLDGIIAADNDGLLTEEESKYLRWNLACIMFDARYELPTGMHLCTE